MIVPSVGGTTLPARLLYLALAAEVSKIVVMVVPGAGVGIQLYSFKLRTLLQEWLDCALGD